MSQQRLKFNNYTPPNVDEDGYQLSFATTATSNSGRTMRGIMYNVPLFTVEAYTLKWTNIRAKDVSDILTQVMGKPEFDFYHFNVYNNKWETDKFYVSNITSPVINLKEGHEKIKQLNFQVTGVSPII